MRRASLATAVAGLTLSLLGSVVAWVYFDSLLFFLFVPFVPILFGRGLGDRTDGRPTLRRCPRCEFQTKQADFEYCPQDGARLERASAGDGPNHEEG